MARRFHRARHHAGRAASGWKGSAMGLASGAVISFGTSMATSRIDFLKASNNWWATPAILGALGHFIKRRSPTLGGALLGIAGAVAVENYTKNPTNAAGFSSILGNAGSVPGDYSNAGAYNDYQNTDASARTNAAFNRGPEAAALIGGPYGAGMLYNDGGMPVGASGMGDADDMMGLQD